MNPLILFILTISAVYSKKADHISKADVSSSGHHVREHEEDSHVRFSESGNVRDRNDKHVSRSSSRDHSHLLMAHDQTDEEAKSWDEIMVETDRQHTRHEVAKEVDEEEVAEEVEEEEFAEEISEETNSEKSESADIDNGEIENEEDVDFEDDLSSNDAENEEHMDEALGGGFEPAKDYVGQGASEERARGSFDRDESIEGRHEVFESPQEIHEEDHEDDVEMAESAESLETDDIESDPEDMDIADEDEVAEIDEEIDVIPESAAEEEEEQSVIVPEINENLELVDQPLTIDEEEEIETDIETDDETEDEIEDEDEQSAVGYSEDTMKDYAGQGKSDERKRGSFDRDETIDGRHEKFESPQEVHEEEEEEEVLVGEESAAGNGAGDTNDDDGEEEDLQEETAEEEVDGILKTDVVLEADNTDSHGRDHGGFNSDGNGSADGGNKQLVSVHGASTPKKVTRHSAGHWLLSMALFVLMMATLSVVAIHFMQKCNAEKVAAHDPEYTPLIADKV